MCGIAHSGCVHVKRCRVDATIKCFARSCTSTEHAVARVSSEMRTRSRTCTCVGCACLACHTVRLSAACTAVYTHALITKPKKAQMVKMHYFAIPRRRRWSGPSPGLCPSKTRQSTSSPGALGTAASPAQTECVRCEGLGLSGVCEHGKLVVHAA